MCLTIDVKPCDIVIRTRAAELVLQYGGKPEATSQLMNAKGSRDWKCKQVLMHSCSSHFNKCHVRTSSKLCFSISWQSRIDLLWTGTFAWICQLIWHQEKELWLALISSHELITISDRSILVVSEIVVSTFHDHWIASSEQVFAMAIEMIGFLAWNTCSGECQSGRAIPWRSSS